MSRHNPQRQVVSTIALLVSVLLSGLSAGLHSEVDPVGVPSHEATTIYYSEHSQESAEEHLHAEAGSRLALCLACFLSVRDKTVPARSLAIQVSLGANPSAPRHLSSAVLVHPGDCFSSRAPPRA